MTAAQKFTKRSFDFICAAFGLMIFSPVLLSAIVVAAWDTGASGIFQQVRIGRNGKPFTVYKIRTMRPMEGTTATARSDPRITATGAVLRKWKIDELPQLWNVLVGDMSFVGPRPDVPGFADKLDGADRRLLELRPGITGPATLHYRNEEDLLDAAEDPERFNRDVVWPHKVEINLDYYDNYSFLEDLRVLAKTLGAR